MSIKHTYNEFLSSAPAPVTNNHEHHIGGRTVRSETTLFHGQGPHAVAVLAAKVSDDLQQHFTGFRYQRDTFSYCTLSDPVFVKYHDGIFLLLLRHLPLFQMQTTISSSLCHKADIPLRRIFNSSTETLSGLIALRSPTSGWCLPVPASWAELLAACARATGKGLRQCSG